LKRSASNFSAIASVFVALVTTACAQASVDAASVDCIAAPEAVSFYSDAALARYNDRLTSIYAGPKVTGGTVMLGDSITEGLPEAAFGDNFTFLNLGVGGDETSGLLKRMGLIDLLEPEQIVVLIGANDIARRRSVEHITTNLDAMLDQLTDHVMEKSIVVLSILPRRDDDRLGDFDYDHTIDVVNAHLQMASAERGVQYVDMYRHMVDASAQRIRPELTLDGVHLSEAGYGLLVKHLSGSLDMNVSANVSDEYRKLSEFITPNCTLEALRLTQKQDV
jgi:lysophospholipase L1-like esterase